MATQHFKKPVNWKRKWDFSQKSGESITLDIGVVGAGIAGLAAAAALSREGHRVEVRDQLSIDRRAFH